MIQEYERSEWLRAGQELRVVFRRLASEKTDPLSFLPKMSEDSRLLLEFRLEEFVAGGCHNKRNDPYKDHVARFLLARLSGEQATFLNGTACEKRVEKLHKANLNIQEHITKDIVSGVEGNRRIPVFSMKYS